MRFEKRVSRHGIPLYVFPMPHVQTVASGILVLAGARDEQWPQEGGIAHALEHMLFQGNSRLGNSKAISEEIEQDGGVINAWTWKEMTFYWRHTPDYALENSLLSLASQVETPLFRPEDIEKEMCNIVEEIKRTHDSPSRRAYDILEEIILGNHPLGQHTLGTVDSVRSFTTDDFFHWHKKFYQPVNYVAIIVGNVTPDDALAALDKQIFRTVDPEQKNARAGITAIAEAKKERTARKDIEQANVYMGTVLGPACDTTTKALDLYTTMLDGGMSFPLFQEVRDKHGLCYAISASVTPWSDHSIFSLYIGTDNDRLREAETCVKDVLWKHRANGDLLKKAKRCYIGRNALLFVSPAAILNYAARDIVFEGTPQSPDNIREEIESIELEEITTAVENLLQPDNLSIARLLPNEQ